MQRQPSLQNQSFNIGDVLKTAWSEVYGAKATIWAGFFIITIITVMLYLIGFILFGITLHLPQLFTVAINVVNYLLTMGFYYIGIQRAFHAPISYKQIYDKTFQARTAIMLIGVFIGIMVIYLIPLVLAGIGGLAYYCSTTPGLFGTFMFATAILIMFGALITILYLSISTHLAIGFVLDKSFNTFDALIMSFRVTRPVVMELFLLYIIMFLITLLSIIPFGIGLIWTIPYNYILYGEVYKRLSANI